MDLIQSIKNFLQNDETKFNEFKNYSGQFRQVTVKCDLQDCFKLFLLFCQWDSLSKNVLGI